MASSSTQRGATTNKSILTPDMTLDGHEPYIVFPPDGGHHEYKSISCISYFPDGKQMISGSPDKTIRRWDLQKGKEIGDAREVCEYRMKAVGVSRDGRWIVTAGFEVKVSEVETGIVRIFHKGKLITWIDISADSKLVVGGSINHEGWIWRLDTGELVAGPFKFGDGLTFTVDIALRFRLSEDSRKLAVLSLGGRCFEVWDVQTQKLDVQQSTPSIPRSSESAPVLWTTKHKSIVTVFNSTSSDLFHTTIYEFDASTFKTVGAPFKGHTYSIEGLALSSDCVLLVSSCYDTIKLWAFESRQLLASFDMESPAIILILSPDSRQLAYTNRNDSNIYICNIPVNILVSIGLAEEPQSSVCIPP
jgi:WD40 repeat protein